MGETDRTKERIDMRKVVEAIDSDYCEMCCLGKIPIAIALDPETFTDLCAEVGVEADVGVNFMILTFPNGRIPVVKDSRYIKCII